MTLSPARGAAAPDAGVTSLLARLDPALAPLSQQVRSWETGRGRLHDVQWAPGERCRLAFRAGPTGPADAGTFVAVDTTPAGCRVYGCRDDTGLPGLAPATDPALVARRLGPVVGGTVRRCRVQPVRYRPGARCVLRYDAVTDAGTTSFYAKVLRPQQFPGVAATRRLLAAAPGPAGAVPRLVAVWPELHAVVEVAVEGPALSAVLADPQASPGRCWRLGHDLGRLLARFHAAPGVGAPAWSPAGLVDALRRSVPPVLRADAALGDRLGSAVDVLAAVAPGPQPRVLGHGAFRSGQVVAGTAGLVVLDTDGVCRCDAGCDLGSAAAYLTWQALRQPHRHEHLTAAGRALLAGYLERGGAEPPTVGWWHAACLLQVAARRYRRLEAGSWALVPSLVDAAEEQLARLLASHTHTLDPATATVLAEAPGRRSVARYTVHGPAGAVPVVGKRFADAHRARLLHEHLRLLHAGPFRHGRYVVPEPVRLVREQHLVLYRACDGDPLDRLRGGALAAGVHDAARWLARLHTCDVRLPRGFSPAHEAEVCDAFAVTLTRTYPRLAARARLLARRWRDAAGDTAGGTAARPAVPLHHDFHPGHVLVGARVCVVDLDEARQGDPAFDVAHFCAYLELLDGAEGSAAQDVVQVSAPEDAAPHGRGLSEAFVREYAAAGGPPVEATYTLFHAYTWLKIAKQWAVGSGPGRDASPAQRRAGAAGALTRAERCLPG